MSQLTSMASRLFFFAAFVLLGLAVLEKVANVFGYTMRFGVGTMLSYAGTALLFVIALLLRQIREARRA